MHLMKNGLPCGREDRHNGPHSSITALERRVKDLNARSRKYDDDKREQVWNHYGTKCAYAEFGDCSGRMEIDHKDGIDGPRCRDDNGGKLYRKLVKLGFPDNFQATCRHHNVEKSWLTDQEYRLIMTARIFGGTLQLGNTEGTNPVKGADAVETTRKYTLAV